MRKILTIVILMLFLYIPIARSEWTCGGKTYLDCEDPYPQECCFLDRYAFCIPDGYYCDSAYYCNGWYFCKPGYKGCCAWNVYPACIPPEYDCNTAFGCGDIYFCKPGYKGYCVEYDDQKIPICFPIDALGGEETIKYCGSKWYICNEDNTVSFCIDDKFICCPKDKPYYDTRNNRCVSACPKIENMVLNIVDDICVYERVNNTCKTDEDCNYDEVCKLCGEPDWNPKCTEITVPEGTVITGLCEKLDCDDGNPYSLDYAENHECKHSYTYPACANSFACKEDELCNMTVHMCYKVYCGDNNICTIDKLDKESEKCVHEWIEGCCITDEDCSNGLICKRNECVEPTIIDKIIRFITSIIDRILQRDVQTAGSSFGQTPLGYTEAVTGIKA